MKRLTLIITLILAAAAPVMAVSPKDMDRARAIAAHAYLRYANDGSGYLDNVRPESMADLEKALKPKEKENLKAFKNIAVPQDYASWDKQKLVDYWSTTAFSSKGLTDKGRIGKSRARKNLNAMKLSAQAQGEAKSEPKTDVQKPEDRKEVKNTSDAPDANVSASVETAGQSGNIAEVSDADTIPGVDEPALAADADEQPARREKDHTWVYVVILCVLVGVVVALVVFASNVMRRNGFQVQNSYDADHEGHRGGVRPVAVPESGVSDEVKKENAELRQRLSASQRELSEVRKTLDDARLQLTQSNAREKAARQQLEAARTEIAALTTALAARASAGVQQPSQPVQPAQGIQTQQPAMASPQQSKVRSIYLGRVNARGIFVRADRILNPGHSFFKLDTSDGYAGTFRVADDLSVWESALANPVENLGAACSTADFTATAGMTRIVTDSAGTAIFEGGCWKVIRKAKVHFE